jgi:2-haloacid dehalogenase
VDLTQFKVLSFDCYGTLIDWESGILTGFAQWRSEAGVGLDDDTLLITYAEYEAAVEAEQPTLRYSEVLAETMRRTTTALGAPASEALVSVFGASVPNWPAFEDSAGALARLRRHYDLVILSNIDGESFAGSNRHLGGDFRAVITAEQVGAYKPSPEPFAALCAQIEEWHLSTDQLLHVAQSIFHDHIPANRAGIASVWINRRQNRAGWGATPKPEVEYTFYAQYGSLAAFADAVDRAFER